MPLGTPSLTLAEAALKRQSELSFLAPQSFFMVIERLPTTTYFIQNITIPTASAGEAQHPNPHNLQTFIPGDTIDYVPLDVQYLVDSKMDSYRTIYEWMLGTNAPQGYEQFRNYTNDVNSGQEDFQKIMSDIHVYATDPASKPVAKWTFHDAFPIALDGPQFDATRPDVEYIVTTASFRYRYYTFESLIERPDPNSFLTQNDKVLIELNFSSNNLAPTNVTSDALLIPDFDVLIPSQNWNEATSLTDIARLFTTAYNTQTSVNGTLNKGRANYVDSTIVITGNGILSDLSPITNGAKAEIGGVIPTVTTTAAAQI